MRNTRKPLLVVGATIVYDYIFAVDRLPEPGRTARILPGADNAQMQPLPGGTAFNIALGLARLNECVRITHPVGRDFTGSAYEQTLSQEGVSLEGLLVNDRGQSGVAYVFGAQDGATMCFTSITELPQKQIPASVLQGINLIVLTPLIGPLHQHAFSFARGNGISLASCGIAEPDVLTWLPQMFMLAINEYEMQLLSHVEPGLGPEELSQRMPGHLYITQGSKGCSVYHRGKLLAHVAATKPRRVVDTTGAGDAFFAAALAASRHGLGPVDAARIGALSGSMVVEDVGCQANLPGWSKVAERAREFYPELAAQLEKVSLI